MEAESEELRQVWWLDYWYTPMVSEVVFENDQKVVITNGNDFLVKAKQEVFPSLQLAKASAISRIANEINSLTKRMSDLMSDK